MGKTKGPDPPNFQKYGVPFYSAAWVPYRTIRFEHERQGRRKIGTNPAMKFSEAMDRCRRRNLSPLITTSFSPVAAARVGVESRTPSFSPDSISHLMFSTISLWLSLELALICLIEWRSILVEMASVVHCLRVAGKGGSIVTWNTATWKRMGSKPVVRDTISAFSVSPDGKLLACGTTQGDILILNSTGMLVQTMVRKAHLGLVTALAFSHDSRAFSSSARVTLIEDKKKTGRVKD